MKKNYKILIAGTIMMLLCLYLGRLNHGVSNATNIHVFSGDNKIIVNWSSEMKETPTIIGIVVSRENVVIDRQIIKNGNEYVFQNGVEGKKYDIIVKDYNCEKQYEFSRLFLKEDSIPNIPKLYIETDGYVDPEYDEVKHPENCQGDSISGNGYKDGFFDFQDKNIEIVGRSKIKIRGNTSAYSKKKPYKIKTEKKYDLLQLGEEYSSNEWVLLKDGMLNTYLGLHIGEICGIDLCPKMRFVNLFCNGDYKGIYILIQPVSQYSFRNNITSNGYIFENDSYWWKSDEIYFKTKWQMSLFGYTVKYPRITKQDTRYEWLSKKMQGVENKLLSVDDIESEIDMHSFATCLLARDIMGISDSGGSNIFYYIESRDNPVIKMGPLWDLYSLGGVKVNQWSNMHNYEANQSRYLWQYPQFVKQYQSSWYEIKDDIKNEITDYLLKLDVEEIEKGRTLEAERWGEDGYIPTVEEISSLISYFDKRIDWIDSQIDYIPSDTEKTRITNGCYRTLCEYDKDNNLICEAYYDKLGKLIDRTDVWYAKKKMRYNSEGLKTEERYFNSLGHMSINNDGYASYKRKYDKSGNITSISYYGTDGKPICISEGYATICRNYDKAGSIIIESYYDEKNSRTVNKNGYSQVQRKFDEKKQIHSESYWDVDNRPCRKNEGYHELQREYDKQGHRISEKYFDEKGNEIRQQGGYSRVDFEYDGDKLISQKYYALGELCTIDKGYAEVLYIYDEGEVTEVRYFDKKCKPVKCIQGYACVKRKYDKYGRVAEERYYDETGRPVLSSDGYFYLETKYDRMSRVIEEKYYGIDGKLITNKNGYASVKKDYDEFSNVTRERYYNEDNTPTLSLLGYDTLERTFDEHNRLVRETFIINGIPSANNQQLAAAIILKYDVHSNIIEKTYLGEDDKPICGKGGFATIKYRYNDYRQLVEESYYDDKDRPFITAERYSMIKKAYDSVGNLCEERFYFGDHLRTGDYAIVKRIYNNNHQILMELYYNAINFPWMLEQNYSGLIKEYDINGNLVNETYIDINGDPIIRDTGFAILRRQYNNLNQVICEIYYGKENEPLHVDDGYNMVKRKFDDKGNVVDEMYFAADGTAFVRRTGYSEIKRKYNEKRQVIEEAYFLNGMPVMINEGYSSIKYSYSPTGLLLKEAYCDNDGRLIMAINGFAVKEYSYDYHNWCVEEKGYDTFGNLICGSDGYAIIKREYDSVGNEIEERTYNEKGMMCPKSDGYCIIRRTWNKEGKMTSERYFNDKNEPVYNQEGICGIELYYDDVTGEILNEVSINMGAA